RSLPIYTHHPAPPHTSTLSLHDALPIYPLLFVPQLPYGVQIHGLDLRLHVRDPLVGDHVPESEPGGQLKQLLHYSTSVTSAVISVPDEDVDIQISENQSLTLPSRMSRVSMIGPDSSPVTSKVSEKLPCGMSPGPT